MIKFSFRKNKIEILFSNFDQTGDPVSGPTEKNWWIDVSIKVETDNLAWSAHSSCITTKEVVLLQYFFEQILVCSEGDMLNEIRFLENELSFRYNCKEKLLYMILSYDFKPKDKYCSNNDDPVVLEFPISEKQINACIEYLKNIISKFPKKRN